MQIGQGIADITPDTRVTAVIIPNKTPTAGIITLPDGTQLNITNPSDWTQYQVSVGELERILNITGNLNYDFFSNLSPEIQNALKSENDARFNASSAALMGDSDLETSSVLLTNQLTIRQGDGSTPSTSKFDQIRSFATSPSQIEILQPSISIDNNTIQNSTSHSSSHQIGHYKSSTSEGSSIEISSSNNTFFSTEGSPIQDGFSQINIDNSTAPEIGSSQVSFTQVDSDKNSLTQDSATQVSTTQVSFSEVNFTQISSIQKNTSESDSAKISLPSSVPSSQFFSIHTLTPESITTINNTAQNLWNTLLAPQTPFDINLQLTDSLAKGQLAEAIVTILTPVFWLLNSYSFGII